MTTRTLPRPIMDGDVFSSLTVSRSTAPYVNPKSGMLTRLWELRCECGNIVQRNAYQLRTGQSTHCGCKSRKSLEELLGGLRFGKLTVIGEGQQDTFIRDGREVYRRRARCSCDCGGTIDAGLQGLQRGETVCCGCTKPKPIAVGDVFGSWTVIGEPHFVARPISKAVKKFLCRCACSTERDVFDNSLRMGTSVGCGCTKAEALSKAHTTHGQTKNRKPTPEHYAWSNMLARCRNPKHPEYHNYGGRGITVCDEWLSFEAFFRDMGTRPSSKHSIDRKENDQGYASWNCRWATMKEQQRNRRDSIIVNFNGVDMHLMEAAELANIDYETVYIRMHKLAWDSDRALLTPGRPFKER